MPVSTRSGRVVYESALEAANVLKSFPRNCGRKRVSASAVDDLPSAPVTKKRSSQKVIRNMKRGSWSEENLHKALCEVERGFLSIRRAARLYGIPHSTLRNHVFHISRGEMSKRPKALTAEEEDELVKWCLDMVSFGTGVTVTMLRFKVADMCAGRVTPFKDGVPGLKWWRLFRDRHPDLALRKPQLVDNARAIALSKPNLDAFYDELLQACRTYGFDANHIWNADESGIQAGKSVGVRVFAKRGSKQVSEWTMKNREWITVLCCVNAAGEKLPNLYIYKGMRFREDYLEGCEPDAAVSMQKKAWMTNDIFKDWINHFKRKVPGGVSPSNPHLLIVDGHGIHVTLETIKMAASTGLHIWKLPAHTSHRLQPLDVSCFRPFKESFSLIRHNYSAANLGVEPSKEDLTGMVREALDASLTVSNIKAGFRKIGIFPFDRTKVQPEMGGIEVQLANQVQAATVDAAEGNSQIPVIECPSNSTAGVATLLQRPKPRKTFVAKDITGTLLITKAEMIARLEMEEKEKREKQKAREKAASRKRELQLRKKKIREEKERERLEVRRLREAHRFLLFGPKNHPAIEAQIAREDRAAAVHRLREKRRRQHEMVEEEDYMSYEDLQEVEANGEARAIHSPIQSPKDNLEILLPINDPQFEDNTHQQNENLDLFQDSQMPISPSEIGCSLSETHECFHGLHTHAQESDARNVFHEDSPMFMYSLHPEDAAMGLNHREGMKFGRRASKRMKSVNSLYADYVQ